MPMLMCPNCNVAMNQIGRKEVEIDMCPTCRGVWLDRGELEKILDNERVVLEEADRGSSPGRGAQQWEPPLGKHGGRVGHGQRDDGHGQGHGGQSGGRRGRRFDLFDLFD